MQSNKNILQDDCHQWGEWYEASRFAREEWLRSASDAGDCYAMEQLAYHLVIGLNTEQSTEQAISSLKRAIDEGYVSALHLFATFLLDGRFELPAESGQAMLRRAAESGFIPAITELGIRLVWGIGFTVNTLEALHWLAIADRAGDGVARALMLCVGGAGAKACPDELGQRGIAQLAPSLYARAQDAITPAIRGRLFAEAASLFLEAHSRGDYRASSRLAHMVRRAEIPHSMCVSLDVLLESGLARRYPLSILNQALRMAAGIQCPVDWREADRMVAGLSGTCGILDLWDHRTSKRDKEFHLVIGWLVRHGLTVDPEGQTPRQRFALATHLAIPGWLGNEND